jgi:ribose transport system substrate-binding protein
MSYLAPKRRSARSLAGLGIATLALTAVAGGAVTSAQSPSAGPDATPTGTMAPNVAPYHGAEPGSGTGLKIGYISLGDSIPFVKIVSDSIAAQATIAGAELVACDSEVDAAKALACAQNLKVQGVQGLLNFQLYEDASEQICSEGPQVPVISIDIHQKPCEISFMGADNTRAGLVIGEAVGNYLKTNFDCQYDAVVLMTALAAGEVITLRSDGTIQGFKNICGEPTNYTVVDVPSIAIDEARTKFTDYLTTVPAAKRIVVMTLNDDMALGALAAADNAGRADQVWIGAHGGDPSAWKEIRCNANWIGDVAYFPEQYGGIGVPAIIDAIKGNAVPAQLYIDHQALNKDNITTYYPDAPAC